jgi:hypothetical protein
MPNDMVKNAAMPSYQGAGLQFKASPDKKLVKSLLNKQVRCGGSSL